jgi:SAM-dependent methyltransferase
MPLGTDEPSRSYSILDLGPQEHERLDRQARFWLPQELPTILDTLPKAGIFVDLGCGTGLLADAGSRARPETQVYGFDMDPLAVKQSRLRFGGNSGLHYECRGLEEGPPRDFPLADVAVMHLVLMHLHNPLEALASAKTWLKPGGILHIFESDDRAIVLEPESFRLHELFDLMQEVHKRRSGSRRLGRDLPTLLSSTGFNVIGQREIILDPLATAMAIPKAFLPVAEFYLKEAERMELIQPEFLQKLNQDLEKIREGKLTSASIPLFHVWARTANGAIR